MADVVAIEHVAAKPAFKQGRIHRIGQGAFAGAAQTREPEDGAAVTALLGPGGPIHRGLMPNDVGGDCHGALGYKRRRPSSQLPYPPACLGR